MFMANKISKSFGEKTLFENVSLQVFPGERIGIVGNNGAGKTTLLKILAGDLLADSGSVVCDEKVAYLKQESQEKDFDCVNFEADSYKIFGKSVERLNIQNIVKTSQPPQDLSGGEKTKLLLANLLAQKPNVLLLDEPTNHLDTSAVRWLTSALQKFAGAVIMVSHNRKFLNENASKIWEIENGKLTEFYGNYDNYQTEKQAQKDYLKFKREKQKTEIKKTEKAVQKLATLTQKLEKSTHRDGSSDTRAKGYKSSVQGKVKKVARSAEAKRNRLEKLIENQIEEQFEDRPIYYRLKGQELASKLIFKATGLSKSFGENVLFENVDFNIENGQKVALLGDNGCGKTTLIKILLGEEDFKGSVWKSQVLKVAYLPQNMWQFEEDETILTLAQKFDGEYKTLFLTNLVGFGFKREMFTHRLSKMSSGERMKIKLNELILSDFNLLILDEPTNHLDLENRIFLEKVLKGFKGSLIVISHDETFIDNVCNKKLAIKNKTIVEV